MLRWDWELPPEAPAKCAVSELPPEQPLGIGHIAPELSDAVAHRGTAAHLVAAGCPHPDPPPRAGEGITCVIGHRVTNPFATSSAVAAGSCSLGSPQPPPPPDLRTRRSPGRITRPVSL